jgi:hypothetical protein
MKGAKLEDLMNVLVIWIVEVNVKSGTAIHEEDGCLLGCSAM